jgi:hypothetical protein
MEEKIVEILFKTILTNTEIEQCTEELLKLFDVSKQSELLKAFVDFYNYRNTGDKTICYDEIEIFIDSL